MAICGEELLSFLDGGHIVRADSRMQRRSEADEDSFAVGSHAVPVVNHKQLVAAPAQVADKPVAVADHGLGRVGSQPRLVIKGHFYVLVVTSLVLPLPEPPGRPGRLR